MFQLFKGKKKQKILETQKVTLLNLDYSPKVILAWAKALEGNKKCMQWLHDNSYTELCMASYAIYLKDKARIWLPKNGYAHLLAFIEAAEGEEKAQKWLLTNQFELLYHMAMAIEAEQTSQKWLQQNAHADILYLTATIKKIKDKIEENHNDIHSFGRDW